MPDSSNSLTVRYTVASEIRGSIALARAGAKVGLIDIDLHGFLDLRVLEHLAQGAAVAATDDRDPFRCLVGEQHRVAHHLVVQEIVARADHRAAVDHHQLAVALGVEHLDLLVRRLLLEHLGPLLQRVAVGGGFTFEIAVGDDRFA